VAIEGSTVSRGAVRVVAFADSGVRIECAGPDAAPLVEFLYGDLPPAGGPVACTDLCLEADVERGILALHGADRRAFSASSIGDLASALLGETMYRLSEPCRGGLLFHAAAVARNGRCLLLPAPSGSGKTTLTAWLVAKGFEYLTDELVYMPWGSNLVTPFIRPLRVKTPAMQVLASRLPHLAAADALCGTDATLLPFRAVGRAARPPEARISAIVFPRYEAGVPLHVGPMMKSDAGMRLMNCLINARNLPGHGFSEAVRLVRDVPISQLRYGDFNQVDEWIERMKGDGW
jgi:hypothetical protein